MKSYKVGDLVRTKYPARTVLVTGREADLKNDKPGYEGILLTGHHKGMPTWGYDEEVGAVFAGSEKRLAEARQLEHSFTSRNKRQRRQSDAIRNRLRPFSSEGSCNSERTSPHRRPKPQAPSPAQGTIDMTHPSTKAGSIPWL